MLDISTIINVRFIRQVFEKAYGKGSSYFGDNPLLDNFTSNGFVKATKNELVYYGIIVNGHGRVMLSSDNTVDDFVEARRQLITYLQRYSEENSSKWVTLTDLIRQYVPVDDRARFYAMAMEVIRIENNTLVVNDFNYRWMEGDVYLTYIGRKNDIELTASDINHIRSKLLMPITGVLPPNLKRVKFNRNPEYQNETLYGWDWFYILEDGKYRKVMGYVLTERENENGVICPSAGAMVTVKDPDGTRTTLFITAYHLSKRMATTDALSPVGGVYQLDDYRYIQVIV